MSKLLFSLRGVPDDEADEIRQLLIQHDIDFYETSPGNWGISMPALWLKDETLFHEASRLLLDYQDHRATYQRALYEKLKQEGKVPTLFSNIKSHPVLFIIHILGISCILYISYKVIKDLWL